MLKVMRLSRSVRSLRRTHAIIGVLISYGFGQLFESFGLPLLRRGRRISRREQRGIGEVHPARRMRLALEELGPTFIKLGQLLSTRPDIIPRSYATEFASLQDKAPSFSFDEVRRQVELELQGRLEDLFEQFDPVPLAAASIAQVHRARLPDGSEVAVKVRRPDIVQIVETDIDILMNMATWAERHVSSSNIFDPVGVVREFARVIRREMDLAREGRTIERFCRNFAGDSALAFPKVYWERTSEGVLTLEYVRGIKVSDHALLDAAGLDRRTIAALGARAFLRQVLEFGLFHGDPHPGNIVILPGNVICLLDYGMVGRLDGELKQLLFRVLHAVLTRDPPALIAALEDAGELATPPDTRALRRDLAEFIDCYSDLPLRDLSVGRMLSEFVDIITRYRIRLDPDLMLLAKALVSIEGMGRELDPEFDMVSHLRPFIDAAVREQSSPGTVAKDVGTYLLSLLNLSRNLPRDLRDIINRINRGTVKIDLEHRGLDRFIVELDKSSNRITSSLILAALLVGSAIIVHADKGPKLLGFPFLAFAGYAGAGIVGIWLVIAIFRSGRM